MFDVVALGECLIDFTPNGINEQGMQTFSQNPGGAPANVLAMYAKLGGHVAFIGKVGNDAFGRFLEKNMKQAGIDVSALVFEKKAPTTLAFVQLDEDGDRSFSFYRDPGADLLLQTDEVDMKKLMHCKIFHFGSVSLTGETSRSATLHAAKTAKKAGAIVSYDPNYRPFLWDCEQHAREEMLAALPLADLVKVSYEEMEFITGKSALQEGAAALAAYGAALVVVTMGAKGAYYHAASCCGQLPAYNVATIDTTGAGDAFWGALLWKVHQYGSEKMGTLGEDEWKDIVSFANAAGSLTTTGRGAIPAMPTKEEIEGCRKEGMGF